MPEEFPELTTDCAPVSSDRAGRASSKAVFRRDFISRFSRNFNWGSVCSYAVRGHAPWSHWHAISTSPDPASLQA